MYVPLLDQLADRSPTLGRSERSVAPGPVTLLAWLEELRHRIFVALSSLVVIFVICFSFSAPLVRFALAPVREALPTGAKLVALRIPEIFLLHLNVSLLVTITAAFPVLLYHIWRLVSSAAPRSQSVAFVPIAVIGIFLFAVGAAFGHFVLFPKGVEFLTNFGSDRIHVLLSVGDVFSLYSRFVLGIGLVFQVPTVVYVLSRLGLVTPARLVRAWKAVVLLAFTLAAVITPTPDVVNQCLLAGPLIVLYVVSIALCWLVRLRHPR